MRLRVSGSAAPSARASSLSLNDGAGLGVALGGDLGVLQCDAIDDLASLAPVAAYPFMKRITWWPQAWLGIVFSWGALVGWAEVPDADWAPGLLLYAGYVARALWWSPRKGRDSDDGAVLRPFHEEPSLPPHESNRIKVMVDYRCDPLWALDEELYGDIAPELMGLSPELTRDLNAWAEAYTS